MCVCVCRRVAVIRIDWPAGKWLGFDGGDCSLSEIEGRGP